VGGRAVTVSMAGGECALMPSVFWGGKQRG
jgi:hypothetical protein